MACDSELYNNILIFTDDMFFCQSISRMEKALTSFRAAFFRPKQGMGSTLERCRYSYWMRKYDHTRFHARKVCLGEQLMELATTSRECADWVGGNRVSTR